MCKLFPPKVKDSCRRTHNCRGEQSLTVSNAGGGGTTPENNHHPRYDSTQEVGGACTNSSLCHTLRPLIVNNMNHLVSHSSAEKLLDLEFIPVGVTTPQQDATWHQHTHTNTVGTTKKQEKILNWSPLKWHPLTTQTHWKALCPFRQTATNQCRFIRGIIDYC